MYEVRHCVEAPARRVGLHEGELRVSHDYDEWGIAHGYHRVDGSWHETSPATREQFRALIGEPVGGRVPELGPLWFVDEGATPGLMSRCRITLEHGVEFGEFDALPADLPIGYHHLAPLDGGPVTTLVVAPTSCPPAPYGWGVAAQVYALWSQSDWGIGDLADLAALAAQVAEAGGRAVLLSPLHAPAPTYPQEDSPYYPSSRRWLNPMLIPLTTLRPPDLTNNSGSLIERNAAWRVRRAALIARFDVEKGDLAWRSWARDQGTDLWRFATWNALAERHGPQWSTWPEPLRRPDSPAVHDLAIHDHDFALECEFHAWLQWLARVELRRVTDSATASGVAIIADLAVGSCPDGADAWIHQDLMALGARIGAPPDPFNAAGQEWGLPPWIPARLRDVHYAPFIAMLRSALEGAGGLRIDHVLGLFRQFWVPAGVGPTEGTYVQLPAHELLSIIRLEATRAGAFVIGEDLGTVQEGVREAMAASGMLGTKVWWFDTAPERWPAANLGTITTHDLPTVAGVLTGSDGSDQMRTDLEAFAVATGTTGDAEATTTALHAAMSQSSCRLVLATLDDLADCTERPNHPGTLAHEQPNWRRRLPGSSEQILSTEHATRLISTFSNRKATPS